MNLLRGPGSVLPWLKCSPILFPLVRSPERGMGHQSEALKETWKYEHVVLRVVVFWVILF